MMEQIDFILDYIGKSFTLLDRIPLIAGVSLGSFLVFMIILDTVIHLTYNQETIRETKAREAIQRESPYRIPYGKVKGK